MTTEPHSLLDTPEYSYSTKVEGGVPVAMRFRVSGRFDDSYLDFVADRAAWLSLSGWVGSDLEEQVTVVVAGPEALVGALEMACVLGPLGALVHTIQAEPEPGLVEPGFVVRRQK